MIAFAGVAPGAAAASAAAAGAAAPLTAAPAAAATVRQQREFAAPTSRAPALPVHLSDDWSRTVSFERLPQRIVSLAPHATELLFASGAGAQVIAVDRNSDYPPSVRSLPTLSSFPQPDAERLLALSPDLVVVWGPGVSRAQLERLGALGLKVFVSDPQRLDEIATTLRRFAQISAAPAVARTAADAFDDRLLRIRSRHAALDAVRVFVQIWSTPLISVADRGVIGDAIRSCGAVNVFGDAPVAAPHLDPEAVIAARPDLVIATDGRQSAARWAERGLLAPRGHARFVVFDASTMERPGPRSIVALEQLCAEIDSARASAK